jgi:hypothetical protein
MPDDLTALWRVGGSMPDTTAGTHGGVGALKILSKGVWPVELPSTPCSAKVDPRATILGIYFERNWVLENQTLCLFLYVSSFHLDKKSLCLDSCLCVWSCVLRG